jgi:CTD nuclear envelope phosphatase 1
MNSLNILSARVSPPQTPGPSRSNSYGNILSTATLTESGRNQRENLFNEKTEEAGSSTGVDDSYEASAREGTPLLSKELGELALPQESNWLVIPKQISVTILDSIRWIFSTLAAPGVYLIACLYDESGNFSPFWLRRTSTTQTIGASDMETSMLEQTKGKGASTRRASTKNGRRSASSSSSGISSESESDRPMSETDQLMSSNSRHTRSKSLQSSDEIAPQRRSIKIKLHNEDSLRQRKHRKSQSTSTQSNGSGAIGEVSPAMLKSPTSPASSSLSMTKYPRAPAPPRPLIPRRQPSYSIPDSPSGRLTQKTLILDLDETLIHSMAKGGRMSTGHMVEVKLNTTTGQGPSQLHPILYYVHKRPHCDDFLRRVSGSLFLIHGIQLIVAGL